MSIDNIVISFSLSHRVEHRWVRFRHWWAPTRVPMPPSVRFDLRDWRRYRPHWRWHCRRWTICGDRRLSGPNARSVPLCGDLEDPRARAEASCPASTCASETCECGTRPCSAIVSRGVLCCDTQISHSITSLTQTWQQLRAMPPAANCAQIVAVFDDTTSVLQIDFAIMQRDLCESFELEISILLYFFLITRVKKSTDKVPLTGYLFKKKKKLKHIRTCKKIERLMKNILQDT